MQRRCTARISRCQARASVAKNGNDSRMGVECSSVEGSAKVSCASIDAVRKRPSCKMRKVGQKRKGKWHYTPASTVQEALDAGQTAMSEANVRARTCKSRDLHHKPARDVKRGPAVLQRFTISKREPVRSKNNLIWSISFGATTK